MPTFKLERDSLQDRFLRSTAKVALYGGGFANGKTSGACIKTLEIARDYPGANILLARSTYPKLNDTLRKEFLKWCPKSWIASFPKSANASNTCTLTNGTTINFRYIQQQGKSGNESTTSNLLSATYDFIVIDQMEDPEIVHKDFLDLLGRLRGMTPYVGNKPDMPKTGPRQMILTTNPTRNWVYRKLVKPIHDLMDTDPDTGKAKRPIINDDLLCVTDLDGLPVKDDNGMPIPMIDLYEGSTYENAANLEADFIQTLEASYKGQMRNRFLMGKWASYEGLVYPTFGESSHVMSHMSITNYFDRLRLASDNVTILEGYDFGMAVPFCYLLGFADELGNVFLMAGSYEKETPLEFHIAEIKRIRGEYNIPQDNFLISDPDIFRRKTVGKAIVGKSISDMFLEESIMCVRGNNNIANGIVKVSQYLNPDRLHQNPITGEYGAPRLFVSDELEFWIDEISDYYWRKDTSGEQVDKPVDKNDHAMDTTRYIFSDRPAMSTLIKPTRKKVIGLQTWGEMELQTKRMGSARHGRS